MNGLLSQRVHCPYCGECFEALIDPSQDDSQYTEDCYVCCQPIIFHCQRIGADDNCFHVATYREDESF